MELYKFNALKLSRLMQNKEVSAVDVVKSFLMRIEKMDKKIRAFISLSADDALETARHVDLQRAGGEKLHPLAGVPVAIKDNICTRGINTTCASNILRKYISPYDATVVSRLRKAGLPILGKTNMDEFAMGSSTENSAFFSTCNPWDINRVPGGSSGGSAAAVAAHETPLALGSDTGGSVRQPAAFCGVSGLRPTYGRISRYGLVAFASSLDQIGTLSMNAKDGAALFHLIAGYDPCDPTTLNYPEIEDHCPGKSVEKIGGLTVGIIKEQTGTGFDERIISRLDQVATYLESIGVNITEVSLPLTDYALAAYYLISPAEACSNLGCYDGLRYGHHLRKGDDLSRMLTHARSENLGMEVKRRIILGTYLLKSGYKDGFYQK
ncbi:MAG: amidase family protein, partial [Dethiobacteria bacterium]